MQPADLRTHLQPQRGVQVGQRLVHEHQRRFRHDRPRDGHPLLLPAGQLRRVLVRLAGQPHQPQRLVHPPGPLGPRDLPHGQAGRGVAPHGQVREQGVVLEHHAETALLRRQLVDAPAVEHDLPVGQRQQPGQAVQRGRLAAAGRPEQRHELAAPDRQVHALQRDVVAEDPPHAVDAQFGEPVAHPRVFPPPTSRSPLPERLHLRGRGQRRLLRCVLDQVVAPGPPVPLDREERAAGPGVRGHGVLELAGVGLRPGRQLVGGARRRGDPARVVLQQRSSGVAGDRDPLSPRQFPHRGGGRQVVVGQPGEPVLVVRQHPQRGLLVDHRDEHGGQQHDGRAEPRHRARSLPFSNREHHWTNTTGRCWGKPLPFRVTGRRTTRDRLGGRHLRKFRRRRP